jgi:cytidylate kinase
MALLTVAGEPGCRVEEVARLAAQHLGFQIVTESTVREWILQQFGSETIIPDRAWPMVVTSLLSRLAMEQPLLVVIPDAELLLRGHTAMLRVSLVASESRRVGLLMLEHRLERPGARLLLHQLERQIRETRRRRFGRASIPPSTYDLVCNVETLDAEPVSRLIELAARAQGLLDEPLLSQAAEAQIQFQMRLGLAKFGITPPGPVAFNRKPFANQSEEIFANLLNFYRITWEYEPKSFPIQWDEAGRVLEAFTPDFYLPEFDLYVELTTMKQAHTTRKNRKVKRLRALYPKINIQVFYQKDFRNLIFKHGLAERGVSA